MVGRRLAAKFLGFDALKGLNESLREEENIYIEPELLSEDDKLNMDIILLKAYREECPLAIKEYKRGRIISHIGYVKRIDMIAHELILDSKRRIPMDSIISIRDDVEL